MSAQTKNISQYPKQLSNGIKGGSELLTLSRLGASRAPPPPRIFCQKFTSENFLTLKSLKRRIKLSVEQFLSYQTNMEILRLICMQAAYRIGPHNWIFSK